MPALLEVDGLVVELDGAAGGRTSGAGGPVRAVDGVSFSVAAGGALGIVGESGCGKSLTARSLLGLLPRRARIAAGSVRLGGRELVGLDERELGKLRGNRASMVFQEPMTSLNPVLSIGDQVAEPLRIHEGMTRRAARDEAVRLLSLVGIADAARRADEHPHRLSGGMRQRVMIAMALACRPDLLIADEPTTALDATIQAQILELLGGLRRERGMALVLITHDLGVVAERCDEVVVMYAGQVVERAAAAELVARPRHPYTVGLLAALPSRRAPGERLAEIRGVVPAPREMPSGCRFAERCDRVAERCRGEAPALAERAPAHLVRCHFPVEEVA